MSDDASLDDAVGAFIHDLDGKIMTGYVAYIEYLDEVRRDLLLLHPSRRAVSHHVTRASRGPAHDRAPLHDLHAGRRRMTGARKA